MSDDVFYQSNSYPYIEGISEPVFFSPPYAYNIFRQENDYPYLENISPVVSMSSPFCSGLFMQKEEVNDGYPYVDGIAKLIFLTLPLPKVFFFPPLIKYSINSTKNAVPIKYEIIQTHDREDVIVTTFDGVDNAAAYSEGFDLKLNSKLTSAIFWFPISYEIGGKQLKIFLKNLASDDELKTIKYHLSVDYPNTWTIVAQGSQIVTEDNVEVVFSPEMTGRYYIGIGLNGSAATISSILLGEERIW